LAVVAAGLGVALLSQEPEVQVVYVERASGDAGNQASAAAKDAPSRPASNRNGYREQFEPRYALDEIRGDLPVEGIIDRRDWAALSDAFAQRMRLQQEQAARNVKLTAAGDGEAPRERTRTYLELRDAMQAM
jgi:hypothetical protein